MVKSKKDELTIADYVGAIFFFGIILYFIVDIIKLVLFGSLMLLVLVGSIFLFLLAPIILWAVAIEGADELINKTTKKKKDKYSKKIFGCEYKKLAEAKSIHKFIGRKQNKIQNGKIILFDFGINNFIKKNYPYWKYLLPNKSIDYKYCEIDFSVSHIRNNHGDDMLDYFDYINWILYHTNKQEDDDFYTNIYHIMKGNNKKLNVYGEFRKLTYLDLFMSNFYALYAKNLKYNMENGYKTQEITLENSSDMDILFNIFHTIMTLNPSDSIYVPYRNETKEINLNTNSLHILVEELAEACHTIRGVEYLNRDINQDDNRNIFSCFLYDATRLLRDVKLKDNFTIKDNGSTFRIE